MRVKVWVVPGSSRSTIDGLHGDHLKVRVASPPELGRANAEVARVLEEAVGARATLVKGMRSRSKVFEFSRADTDQVRGKLGI